MPHIGFQSLSPVDLAEIEKVIFPHLDAMHGAIQESWPALDPEMVMLQILCLRSNLKPPTWWPSHVRHPIIACMSRPSSVSKGQARPGTTARSAVGSKEATPCSAWSTPEPLPHSFHRERQWEEPRKAFSPSTPETRASPDFEVADVTTPRWKTCQSASPEPDDMLPYADQLLVDRPGTSASRHSSKPVSEYFLGPPQAPSDNPRVFETSRPASAAGLDQRAAVRPWLGEPHHRPAPPPVHPFTPGTTYPGTYVRDRRVRPGSAGIGPRPSSRMA